MHLPIATVCTLYNLLFHSRHEWEGERTQELSDNLVLQNTKRFLESSAALWFTVNTSLSLHQAVDLCAQ